MTVFSSAANAYETALITYPEYNKNWKQVYFGKQDDEVISQWIPSYSYTNDWVESVVFHAYRRGIIATNLCPTFLPVQLHATIHSEAGF